MLDKLKQRYSREAFQPSWLGLFVNPFYFARKGLHEQVVSLAHNVRGRVLDIGCGEKPYQDLFRPTGYCGLELDTPANRADKKADLFYDGTTLPFENKSFDSVIVNQVLEHVFTPENFLREVNRVLCAGGTLFLTVPFVWDEHEQPCDFGRYSSFGLRAILTRHGFNIVEQKKSVSGVKAIFQLVNAYTYKKTLTRSKYLRLAAALLLIAPVTMLGEILARILPGNEDFYLDNIVLAKKAGDD